VSRPFTGPRPTIAVSSIAASEIANYDARNASFTLALTIPGDTLLYLLLPLNHAVFGVSLTEAGLLLAANRLVRIAGYGWGGSLLRAPWPTSRLPVRRRRLGAGDLWLRAFYRVCGGW
jgi:hypothetical protein